MKIKNKVMISTIPPLLIIVLFVLFTLFILVPVENLGDNYILGAHRGNSIDFIENTLPAFESAVNNEKYKFIEFDIQYTKDKHIILHHDLSLARLQQKPYKIQNLNYEELLIKSNYYIPNYSEVMNIVSKKKPLNIEIKSQGNFEDDKKLADFIISDLTERNLINSTLISSVSKEIIRYINEKYNNYSYYTENLSKEEVVYFEEYYNKDKWIDTGVVYYIEKSTFFHGVCDWFKETELYHCASNEMIQGLTWSGANYLMVHGSNMRDNYNLQVFLPKNSAIVFWNFDDKMYLILPNKENWKKKYNINIEKFGEIKPWWID
ncbi:MAG TPA: glycerophosphodiester phosphodiesterase family protein [Candidatus Paceibacterota bacterium]|nr:glycerophosphodiester phosphodiesterase family protein [Candidatus Paceibacterota bacterium]